MSQLDLKLQCAQEQLKIQNRQLFKQYLENLLANKNLQEYIRLIHLIVYYLQFTWYLSSADFFSLMGKIKLLSSNVFTSLKMIK